MTSKPPNHLRTRLRAAGLATSILGLVPGQRVVAVGVPAVRVVDLGVNPMILFVGVGLFIVSLPAAGSATVVFVILLCHRLRTPSRRRGSPFAVSAAIGFASALATLAMVAAPHAAAAWFFTEIDDFATLTGSTLLVAPIVVRSSLAATRRLGWIGAGGEEPHCSRCGYDLRAFPRGTCRECVRTARSGS